jgi:hypothetical protein|tara:strand:- start:302 stop:598 length:297 start_codon:yes stop_codon:yes gene_type:complete
MKNDRILFGLAPGWALGADRNQWIVMRRRKRRDQHYWNPISFIGSTKTTLLRVLREKGIHTSEKGQAALDSLPERFLDWRDNVDSAPSVISPKKLRVA